jgi:hypothetical protein
MTALLQGFERDMPEVAAPSSGMLAVQQVTVHELLVDGLARLVKSRDLTRQHELDV